MSCYKSNFDYLKEQIDSIICQTENDWELLIYNDGQEDNEEFEHFIYKYTITKKVNYFSNGHIGYSKAHDFLIKQAKGEYICMCDHDDVWKPRKLEIEKKYLDEHPDVDCVFGWLHWFGEKEKIETFSISDEDISKELYFWQPIKNPTAMFRRERFGNFDCPFDSAADFWFWAKHKDRQYHLIEKVLAYYRRHPGEATKDKTAFRLNSAKVIQHSLEQRFPDKVFPLELCEKLDRYSKKYDEALKERISEEIWK